MWNLIVVIVRLPFFILALLVCLIVFLPIELFFKLFITIFKLLIIIPLMIIFLIPVFILAALDNKPSEIKEHIEKINSIKLEINIKGTSEILDELFEWICLKEKRKE